VVKSDGIVTIRLKSEVPLVNAQFVSSVFMAVQPAYCIWHLFV